MALPQGRLWAAVLLLSIAIAAAQTANALSPQAEPPIRSSSSLKAVQLPHPTPEDLWDKAVRGLKSITLSPQPEPPSARYTQLARRWQPVPQAPLRLYKPALPAVRGLKAVSLSPQPEPPGSRAHQQAQRFMRWRSDLLVKAPSATAPLAPHVDVPLARAAGRGLNGLAATDTTAARWASAKPKDTVSMVDMSKFKGFDGFLSGFPSPGTPQSKPEGGLGLPGTGDREGGYFAACGTVHQFKTIDCSSWSNAPDLAASGRQTSSGMCDRNVIVCRSGAEGRKRDIYNIEVSDVHGQRSKDGQAGYYARARIMLQRNAKPDQATGTVTAVAAVQNQEYCWKRVGAGGDGCGCLCAVALQGSTLSSRGCTCESV